jgi:hypothetical protein
MFCRTLKASVSSSSIGDPVSEPCSPRVPERQLGGVGLDRIRTDADHHHAAFRLQPADQR